MDSSHLKVCSIVVIDIIKKGIIIIIIMIKNWVKGQRSTEPNNINVHIKQQNNSTLQHIHTNNFKTQVIVF